MNNQSKQKQAVVGEGSEEEKKSPADGEMSLPVDEPVVEEGPVEPEAQEENKSTEQEEPVEKEAAAEPEEASYRSVREEVEQIPEQQEERSEVKKESFSSCLPKVATTGSMLGCLNICSC